MVVVIADGAAVDAAAAAVRDSAEFLDVDVDQLARRCLFVADRLRLADRQPGGLIKVRQRRHPITGEDPLDR